MLVATDAAYIAGILDGEGTISINFRNPRAVSREVNTQLTIQVCVTMTDYELIKWLREITDCGNIYSNPARQVHHKPTWSPRPGIADAYEIIAQCLPYMKTKRRQGEIYLELVEMRRTSTRSERNWTRQFDLATENRRLNQRGVVQNSNL